MWGEKKGGQCGVKKGPKGFKRGQYPPAVLSDGKLGQREVRPINPPHGPKFHALTAHLFTDRRRVRASMLCLHHCSRMPHAPRSLSCCYPLWMASPAALRWPPDTE